MAAYTATLNTRGIKDVKEALGLISPVDFIHSLDRPSIMYNIFHKTNENAQVYQIVKGYGVSQCGIIYCMTKSKTEEISKFLNSKGIQCKPYHAGLGKKVKAKLLSEYLDGSLNLIAATIAFGMGIDRPDVRYVIHADAPANIENYMQETGRLSRDGKLSQAYMLYSPSDIKTQLWMATQSIKHPDRLRINLNKIKSFKNFCESTSCRRVNLLSFFDQSPDNCNTCDVCLGYSTITENLYSRRSLESH